MNEIIIRAKTLKQSCEEEIGVFNADKNCFKKNEKIIKILSQISYRILNYILYIPLFVTKLIANKKEFDEYLSKGIFFEDILYMLESLKKELLKENIDSIEIHVFYIY